MPKLTPGRVVIGHSPSEQLRQFGDVQQKLPARYRVQHVIDLGLVPGLIVALAMMVTMVVLAQIVLHVRVLMQRGAVLESGNELLSRRRWLWPHSNSP